MKKIYKATKNYQIPAIDGIFIVAIISGVTAFGLWYYSSHMTFPISNIRPVFIKPLPQIPQEPTEKKFIPQPFTMNELKTRGCVADGLLSGYGNDTKHIVALINRSPCVYLHRSLETWLNPPNFKLAERIMNQIDKPHVVFGMFISEAIRTNATFRYDDGDRDFDFKKMCRAGSDGAWGPDSCNPDFKSPEYRKYLRYITRKAIDLGIQSFLFGQIYYQENPDKANPVAPEIAREMRDYAQKRGVQIVIGAQTNDITDPNYLKTFDYIEGGVGINNQGAVENGPCWSRKSTCWALLWHSNFAKNANNVFLNLDWNGIKNDDMSTFARMDKTAREETIKNLYTKFTSQGMGFMIPYQAVLNRDNGGCWGPKKNFYTPDDKYKCKDENWMSGIFGGGT